MTGRRHYTTKQVQEIRRMYADESIPVSTIVEKFGLNSNGHCWQIATGRSYSLVPGAVPARKAGPPPQFSDEEVKAMREWYDRQPLPKPTMVGMAARYNTEPETVSRIMRGIIQPDAGGPVIPAQRERVRTRDTCRHGHPRRGNEVKGAPADCRTCKSIRYQRYQERRRQNIRIQRPHRKLTDADVRDIRSKLGQGIPGTRIAEEYGVQRQTIYQIKSGTRRAAA